MYVISLPRTYCVKKTSVVSCTLLCESGDRVMVDQSSFSAYLHAVMLRHHCSEYVSRLSIKSFGETHIFFITHYTWDSTYIINFIILEFHPNMLTVNSLPTISVCYKSPKCGI